MADRKTFTDSVVPLPPSDGLEANGLLVQASSTHDDTERMEVMFSLPLPE